MMETEVMTYEDMGQCPQETVPASILPTQLCYKCGGVVQEGTAFCDKCRGTALFQKVNTTRQGSDQKQEKVKMLRASIAQVAHKKANSGKPMAAVGVLVLLMALAGTVGYYFMYSPH